MAEKRDPIRTAIFFRDLARERRNAFLRAVANPANQVNPAKGANARFGQALQIAAGLKTDVNETVADRIKRIWDATADKANFVRNRRLAAKKV